MKTKLPKLREKKQLSKIEAEHLRDGIIDDMHAIEGRMMAAALKLDRFIKGRGWVALGYDSMIAWRDKEIPTREFYNLRNVGRLLEAGIAPEVVQKMPLTNVNVMARNLPEKSWKDPKWQKAAQELPVADFERRALVAGEEMGTAAEEVQRRGFIAPLSLVKKWDLAIRVSKAVDGAQGMEESVEAIVSSYLDSDSTIPGRSKVQAYADNFGSGE